MGDHEVFERAVARDLDGLDREPKPITKKLIDILVDNNDLDLQVVAIKRGKPKMVVLYPNMPMVPSVGNSELAWSEEWHAWSCRPASGIYQQIIVFMPREDDE